MDVDEWTPLDFSHVFGDMSKSNSQAQPQSDTNNVLVSQLGSDQDPFNVSNDPTVAKKTKQSKRNRFIQRLDAPLLLSEAGLPKLNMTARKIKFKGKGHESQDLKKLMNYLQIWAHELKPDLTFLDAMTKIEKICRENRCKGFLDGIISEERRKKLGIIDDREKDQMDRIQTNNVFGDSEASSDEEALMAEVRNVKAQTLAKEKERLVSSEPLPIQNQATDDDDGDILGLFKRM